MRRRIKTYSFIIGSYRIYQASVPLTLSPRGYYRFLYRNLKKGKENEVNEITGTEVNLARSAIKKSCINMFQVVGVSSVGPGVESNPVCILASAQGIERSLGFHKVTLVDYIGLKYCKIYISKQLLG